MRLDPALWMDRPGVAALLEALGAPDGLTRLVGGAVRDWLAGLPAGDLDLATRLRPEQTMATLKRAGLRALPTGLAHGTVTAMTHGQPIEITSLRADVATDGRRATVRFTDDWRADAARRDFTINALYADPLTGAIQDWFGGIADLEAGRVRFIGDPATRIAEDHLRILRFFRFTARFARVPDAAGVEACAARANDLMALSRERIRDELLKLLALPCPTATVRLMLDRGILMPVLPEIAADAADRLARLIEAEAAAGVAPDALRRLAALLQTSEAVTEIAHRLRLSKAERQRLEWATGPEPVPDDPRALAYRIGGEATRDRMLLKGDPRAPAWAGALGGWARPRLPVTGGDLIAMGLAPGPAVARRLAEVEARWIAAGFPGERHRVQAIARDVLGLS